MPLHFSLSNQLHSQNPKSDFRANELLPPELVTTEESSGIGGFTDGDEEVGSIQYIHGRWKFPISTKRRNYEYRRWELHRADDRRGRALARGVFAEMSIVTKYLLKVPAIRNVVGTMARAYQANVEAELKRYGLRYDDLLNEYDPEVKKAIETLSPIEQELRNKRLKRAMDLDIKKTYLTEDVQEKEDVWNPYLSSRMEELKQRRYEKQIYE